MAREINDSKVILPVLWDITHHALNEFNQNRDVAQIVKETSRVREFPGIALLPEQEVVIEVIEKVEKA